MANIRKKNLNYNYNSLILLNTYLLQLALSCFYDIKFRDYSQGVFASWFIFLAFGIFELIHIIE